MDLNIHQKRQAALLYHYTSAEYLESIIAAAREWLKTADATLDQAERSERDKLMALEGWEVGDTAANWSTYGHPMLADMMRMLYKQRAERAVEKYAPPNIRFTYMGLQHFSLNWTLPEEERKFEDAATACLAAASPLDAVLRRSWDDVDFEAEWETLRGIIRPLPRYKLRSDVVGESGRIPPRTGVYVPADDPFGALQFAWTGDEAGALGSCVTFTDLAKEYCALLGRELMWRNPHDPASDVTDLYFDKWCEAKGLKVELGHGRNPHAFTSRPCKWYFVERIEGEYEDEPAAPPTADRLRGEPGTRVPRSGWWYTPSIKGEQGFRYFEEGSHFPDTAHTEWGAVFWQFDPERQPK